MSTNPDQLALIDDVPRDWRLDERTREIGRRGVSAARELLASLPRRHDSGPQQPPHPAQAA